MSRAGVSVEPILRDLPEWFESERLSIRPPRPGDGSMVLEAVRDSLADLRRIPALMRWALAEPSIESSERFCRDGYSNFLARRDLPLLLLLKQPSWLVRAACIAWIGACQVSRWVFYIARWPGLLIGLAVSLIALLTSRLRIIKLSRSGAAEELAEKHGALRNPSEERGNLNRMNDLLASIVRCPDAGCSGVALLR